MGGAGTTAGTTSRAALAARPRLLRLAYRYLGSVHEAEDAVQDAYLRLTAAPEPDRPEAWLARVVTNLCLDRLRRQRSARKLYVGPWLPEPVGDEPDFTPEERELDLSLAVMRALERLTPLERAAFFLHDLFDVDFETVGATLSRSAVACRKLASRARRAVREGEARIRPEPAEVDALLEAIAAAGRSGDLDPLVRLLSDQVDLVSDGGGRALAARNVVSGADAVARLLRGLASKYRGAGIAVRPVRINGAPGVAIEGPELSLSLLTLDTDAEGRIAGIYLMRNPGKLARFRA